MALIVVVAILAESTSTRGADHQIHQTIALTHMTLSIGAKITNEGQKPPYTTNQDEYKPEHIKKRHDKQSNAREQARRTVALHSRGRPEPHGLCKTGQVL